MEELEVNDALPNAFELQQLAGHPEHLKSETTLKLSPNQVAHTIDERDLSGFRVDSGKYNDSLGFSLIQPNHVNCDCADLRCHVGNAASAPNDWHPVIQKISLRFPTIGGWQWHHYYQCWQWNKCVELGYERNFGTIPPGFHRVYEPSIDGIGPGRTLLDISLNPGRPKQLFPTINFYPTAEMWLGPHFWQYAVCTKEEALDADFFLEKKDTPHYLYLKCWPEPFTRPDGEQGRMQQRLWKLFFNEDCEWPPGSGTICDEPMYGPPELMPNK
jgi:hypothetical protein